MRKQAIQAGIIKAFCQNGWRKLAPVLAVVLLLAFQTLSGGLCLCASGEESPRPGCHGMRSPAQPARAMPEGAALSVGDAPFGLPAYGAMSCCLLPPDAEAPAIPAAAQNQGLTLATEPFIHLGAQFKPAPLPYNFQHPRQTRPLYLSYSCLLI